jgi:hypothetical protein
VVGGGAAAVRLGSHFSELGRKLEETKGRKGSLISYWPASKKKVPIGLKRV